MRVIPEFIMNKKKKKKMIQPYPRSLESLVIQTIKSLSVWNPMITRIRRDSNY